MSVRVYACVCVCACARVRSPGSCMDAGGLFRGEATLRKIFCLQETLRGVATSAAPTESLLQADRVLFLPSPLLPEGRDNHRQPQDTHGPGETQHLDLRAPTPEETHIHRGSSAGVTRSWLSLLHTSTLNGYFSMGTKPWVILYEYFTTGTIPRVIYHGYFPTGTFPRVLFHGYFPTGTISRVLYHGYFSTGNTPWVLFHGYFTMSTTPLVLYHGYFSTGTIPWVLCHGYGVCATLWVKKRLLYLTYTAA